MRNVLITLSFSFLLSGCYSKGADVGSATLNGITYAGSLSGCSTTDNGNSCNTTLTATDSTGVKTYLKVDPTNPYTYDDTLNTISITGTDSSGNTVTLSNTSCGS